MAKRLVHIDAGGYEFKGRHIPTVMCRMSSNSTRGNWQSSTSFDDVPAHLQLCMKCREAANC